MNVRIPLCLTAAKRHHTHGDCLHHSLLCRWWWLLHQHSCMQGRVYAPGDAPDPDSDAIREFNQVVIQDPRVEAVTLPVRDGITLVRPRGPASGVSEGPRSASGPAGMPLGGMSNPQTPAAREISCGAVGSVRVCSSPAASAAAPLNWSGRDSVHGRRVWAARCRVQPSLVVACRRPMVCLR